MARLSRRSARRMERPSSAYGAICPAPRLRLGLQIRSRPESGGTSGTLACPDQLRPPNTGFLSPVVSMTCGLHRILCKNAQFRDQDLGLPQLFTNKGLNSVRKGLNVTRVPCALSVHLCEPWLEIKRATVRCVAGGLQCRQRSLSAAAIWMRQETAAEHRFLADIRHTEAHRFPARLEVTRVTRTPPKRSHSECARAHLISVAEGRRD